ncbi:hypothetical protein TBR22_A04670 [Luteitalea sp. TBR-22]|uniref:DUF1015 domain-containing protein n=1 Tax=Luteitalea sp. TBR-22 TaxID=2802971 RepID=UPI001AF3E46C|nr:DUF1015 family protein [Luteitalea sp. TBR-22]BCS31267.1 hypothetical protein TBR22_A04670 [Luteitalea sp. TBR-22]
MALVRPFRALRPRPDLAAEIAAVPYDVVSTEEARALAAGKPNSFLHVSRAEIDLPSTVSPYADEVYTRAWETFEAFRSSALVQDARPTLYVYRLRMGDHEQTGLAGAFSVDEYRRDVILKHERTRKDKEDDRTRHITELRAQTGPVLLTYRGTDASTAAIAAVTAGTPLYDFTADDGIAHTVWAATPEQAQALVAAFADVPRLYIADGHHRAASAARAQEALGAEPDEEGSFFLAVAFPDSQMRILPYHRVVKDLNGHTVEALLTVLSQQFPMSAGTPSPSRKGECGVFVRGKWYTLTLGDQSTDPADPIRTLDVSRLQDRLLAPILGIADPRTDTRIDFVGGIRGTGELEKLVNARKAAIAFSMYPVTLDELMAIADAGAIMPPKSTWFEPKLRDGLLSHEI